MSFLTIVFFIWLAARVLSAMFKDTIMAWPFGIVALIAFVTFVAKVLFILGQLIWSAQ